MSRQFIKKGDKIIVKEDIPDIELKPKDVMTNITNLVKNIQQTQQQIMQNTMQTDELKKNLGNAEDALKNISKFEEWANTAQMSKLKNLLPAAVERSKKIVEETYKFDEGLTKEQNNIQKYHQLMQYTGRDKEISENIAFVLIQAHVYNKDMIANPWV